LLLINKGAHSPKKKSFILIITLSLLFIGCVPDFPGYPEIRVQKDGGDIFAQDSIFLGAVAPGSSVDVVFKIRNIGFKSDLLLSGSPPVSVSGDGFSITSQPGSASVAAGASVTFTVRFSPSAKATYAGTVGRNLRKSGMSSTKGTR
jgi:hypothetical protein